MSIGLLSSQHIFKNVDGNPLYIELNSRNEEKLLQHVKKNQGFSSQHN
jgi:hypothetical protein